jgi:hypothetical protein
MITKSRASLLLAVVALFFAVPATNTFAATSSADKKNIQKYSKQLNALTDGAGPNSKVLSLVKKLTKLDAAKASKYYNTGLKKLSNAASTAKADAAKMKKDTDKNIKKSDLSASKQKSISKKVAKAEKAYNPPTPPVS